VRDKADGGRVGFVEGGWADDLTGQGLSIYNSMTAGGHGDEAIQNTLKELGYWPIPAATGIETIVNTGLDQGGGGDGGGGGITNGYNVNQGLGTTNITDYEAEAYGVGPTWAGSWAKLKDDLSNIKTPTTIAWDLAKKGFTGIGNWFNQQKEKRDIKKEQKAAELAAELAAQQAAAKKAAGYDESGGWTSPSGRDHAGTGGIGSPESQQGAAPGQPGASKDWRAQGGRVGYTNAGLATMFTRRR
jgi:hypothetical protein